MRFLNYLDEIYAVYKFYKLCLKYNMRHALIIYFASLIGFLIYFVKFFFLNQGIADLIILAVFEIIVIIKGYSFFKDLFLDLHSPD